MERKRIQLKLGSISTEKRIEVECEIYLTMNNRNIEGKRRKKNQNSIGNDEKGGKN